MPFRAEPMEVSSFRRLCKDLAPIVTEAAGLGLDAYALLYMLGGVESSFGIAQHQPRYEKVFSRSGRYGSRKLDKLFGDLAACSYGPWQIMFANARTVSPEVTPVGLMEPQVAGLVTAQFLNAQLKRFKPRTPTDVLDIWNTGYHRDDAKPAKRYTDKGLGYYQTATDLMDGAR